jgi:predicted transcriptional regulator
MSEPTVQVRPDLTAKLEHEQRNIARIREGLAQARRGEFATDEEVKAFFARHGKPAA